MRQEVTDDIQNNLGDLQARLTQVLVETHVAGVDFVLFDREEFTRTL
jgi:D-alanine-D-alanine ligase-like ATP-grasp enzyme